MSLQKKRPCPCAHSNGTPVPVGGADERCRRSVEFHSTDTNREYPQRGVGMADYFCRLPKGGKNHLREMRNGRYRQPALRSSARPGPRLEQDNRHPTKQPDRPCLPGYWGDEHMGSETPIVRKLPATNIHDQTPVPRSVIASPRRDLAEETAF